MIQALACLHWLFVNKYSNTQLYLVSPTPPQCSMHLLLTKTKVMSDTAMKTAYWLNERRICEVLYLLYTTGLIRKGGNKHSK